MLDLLCIGRAYRRDKIACFNRRFDEVHLSADLHQPVVILVYTDSEDIFQDILVKAALILDIMNGEHGFYPFQPFASLHNPLCINANQRRLPVVGMNDVGAYADMGNDLQSRLGKESKPFPVIVIPVNVFPFIIIFVIDQKAGNPFVGRFKNAAVLFSPGQGHLNAA
ncbi:hypothetical protein SDC9_166221 [bioreactor metagenome]|uniref:Uncharacterized protein n=1 Tax=bioreactor metagenome TaxID=1076179 RepID=A0A645FY84_9ZZZZ